MCHKILWLFVICVLAMPGHADEKGGYAGLGVGLFDGDYDDSEQPHLESLAANVFLGYDFNVYLGVETQIEYVNKDSELDQDGFATEFSGLGVMAGVVMKLPLDREDDFALYGRVGGTFWDYQMRSQDLGGSVETQTVTPHLAFGIKSRYLFLEYVNHGKENALHLEQLRGGFRVLF
ncbi:MAG: outer membrane beta-barrel protein [bacterium]